MPIGTPTRTVSADLLAAITAEASTLAALLLITPEGGAPVGFTSHDDEITVGGNTYHPDPGLNPTELAAALAYSVDNLEIHGAFDDELVKEDDVTGGVFDEAEYRLVVVDFENPLAGEMVVQTGWLGAAEAIDERFRIELRSLTQRMQHTVGEVRKPTCRAQVFDDRCGLDEDGTHPGLGIPYKYASVAVTEVISRFRFKAVISGVTIPAGFFETGLLVWQTGVNQSQKSEVKTHTVSGTTHTITLQEPTRAAFTAGDTFRVRKGCKKRLDPDCLDVENVINMRAETYLPGIVETMRRPT